MDEEDERAGFLAAAILIAVGPRAIAGRTVSGTSR